MSSIQDVFRRDRSSLTVLVTPVLVLSVMIAVSVLGGGWYLKGLVDGWRSELTDRFTVQIPVNFQLSLAEEMEKNERVVGELLRSDGVVSARVLSGQEQKDLFSPWSGERTDWELIPLPVMIDVTLRPDQQPDLAAIESRLHGIDPGIVIDLHMQWIDEMAEWINLTRLAVFVVLATMLATITTLLALVVRLTHYDNRHSIMMLHYFGSGHRFIIKLFERFALLLLLRSTAIGIAIVVMISLGFSLLFDSSIFIFLDPGVWATLFVYVFLTVIGVLGVVHLVVRRQLASLY